MHKPKEDIVGTVQLLRLPIGHDHAEVVRVRYCNPASVCNSSPCAHGWERSGNSRYRAVPVDWSEAFSGLWHFPESQGVAKSIFPFPEEGKYLTWRFAAS